MPEPETVPSQPQISDDLALLVAASQAAAKIALPFWRADPKVWDKADAAGPVTEADLAVDAYLRDTLTAARPSYGWLSEETPDTTDRLSAAQVFIVDPIDGTRAFIDGDGNWAHSLAIARNGQITAAVVHLPARDRLYSAALNQGAELNGEPITAPGTANTPPTLLANKWSLQERYWPNGGPPDIKRHFRSSLAYRMALIGEGRFDAMVTFRDTWEWDIAAGALIATEAGARVCDRFGQAIRFNSPNALSKGILAGSSDLIDDFVTRHDPQ